MLRKSYLIYGATNVRQEARSSIYLLFFPTNQHVTPGMQAIELAQIPRLLTTPL